ncbi:MAG TPA: LD-carboxypeptidase [Gemmatimonadaceae bacterium]|nr:LD-carboxypeptidase [Gemmatimonadaceae bacterium]
MILYPTLDSGARVALVAPAGPIKIPADLERAKKNARTLGWDVVLGEHAREREGYFAGSDDERLADLNAAIRDDSIDAIWCLRGGYGAMRLLDGLDYDALKRRPKAIIGYSDITALHCAVRIRCGLSSIHGPTARSTLTGFAERSLRHAVLRDADCCGTVDRPMVFVGGRARGRLLGGNLALLAALHGTPYEPDYTGAILVLEDVNEAPYRIERMLLQLRLSGALQRCAGIAFGSFTNTGEKDEAGLGGTRPLRAVLEEAARAANVPSIGNVPVGHIDDQWSIPFGLEAELDADAGRLTVIMP